jgi:hypothetical protein
LIVLNPTKVDTRDQTRILTLSLFICFFDALECGVSRGKNDSLRRVTGTLKLAGLVGRAQAAQRLRAGFEFSATSFTDGAFLNVSKRPSITYSMVGQRSFSTIGASSRWVLPRACATAHRSAASKEGNA